MYSDDELFTSPMTFMGAPYGRPGPGNKAAILGIPFDCGTNMRIGARGGPDSVRQQSALMRRFNPTHAIARADIRLPVGITTDVLAAKLDQWLAPLEGVTWRAIRRFEASFTPPGDEIVARTAKVAAEVLGTTPAINMRVGGSDSRWYRPAGVPTVVLGLTPFNMGGPDEYVLVDELLAVAKIHTLTAYDFLTGG